MVGAEPCKNCGVYFPLKKAADRHKKIRALGSILVSCTLHIKEVDSKSNEEANSIVCV